MLALAREQGLLRGRHASRVQQFGLAILLAQEQHERSQEFLDRFKMALISNNPAFIESAYPEIYKEEQKRYVEETDIEDLLTDTTGDWSFEESSISPEDAAKILSGGQTTMVREFTADDMTFEPPTLSPGRKPIRRVRQVDAAELPDDHDFYDDG